MRVPPAHAQNNGDSPGPTDGWNTPTKLSDITTTRINPTISNILINIFPPSIWKSKRYMVLYIPLTCGQVPSRNHGIHDSQYTNRLHIACHRRAQGGAPVPVVLCCNRRNINHHSLQLLQGSEGSPEGEQKTAIKETWLGQTQCATSGQDDPQEAKKIKKYD